MSGAGRSDDSANAGGRPGRRVLVLATAAGACAIAAAAAVPALVLVAAPLGDRHGEGRWVRTVKLSELRDGEAKRVAIVDDRKDAWMLERGVELGSVWVVRRGNDVVAFSAVCPHLGCSVNALPANDGGGFSCPCHTSAFDAAGKKKSGPSPRDLDRLETRIEDGHIAIDFRRFKIGVAEKVQA